MGLFGKTSGPASDPEAVARAAAWTDAIQHETLPAFVDARLKAASAGTVPWLSTTSPAELLLGKSHGMRALTTVSGTCWTQYRTGSATGYLTDEWGNFARGWNKAVERMKREAVAAGANAVVDVRVRSSPSPQGLSADFTVFGTAVKFARLPASSDPVIATVSALDFVRLLECGIVVCGLGTGTAFDFVFTPGLYTETRPGGQLRAQVIRQQMRLGAGNQHVEELTEFWEKIRRQAHQALRSDTARIGRGVLAHTNFSQLSREGDNYFGRHIVIGTIVLTGRQGRQAPQIRPVIDMRDDLSPLKAPATIDAEAVLTSGLRKHGS
jgi:hypothetical protein